MTLNELRFIVAVAQERNFRRAAEKSFISQPALSLAIQKLEEELCIQIFERGKKAISITPIGMQIIEQAQRTLEEAGHIREIAKQGNNQLSGTLRIGFIYSVGPYLLPCLVPVLKKLAPDMPLNVEENITANLDALLRNGKLDVIVIALPFGDTSILTKPLYDEPFEVVVGRNHPWANRHCIRTQELAAEKVLLLNSGHCFSNQVAEACPELNHKSTDIQQGTSLETIRNMVASGFGITVLPASANSMRYPNRLLKVIQFSKPVPTRRIALAWRRSFFRTQAIEVLAQAIVQSRITGIKPLL
ncbi:Hydrogen peroxide-inducible genes activator [Candidatus Nitrotoga sp. HW29]|uniref:hydrogen peroxide-inducible genes activator n=1 Tax=Candidatus Nitrotoga sp. HW29 TaxID=2886963 RepID=UPI001EF27F01|nr:hydrogen peroxide-inducible genes activator [Candidatus Nitrotoga sp. HW29]CAH1905197.1 Hydrogen peroxide-inducible genes activator [Candidatus Nitrotoga sp. HW29]